MTTPQNESANDTTVFQGEASNAGNQPGQSGVLSELVGEGKKFKTVDDLAKGKLESDMFIDQLKKEVAELRKELEAGLGLKDVMSEIEKVRNQPAPREADTPASLDPNELSKLVEDTMTELENKKTLAANIKEADRMIVEKFNGDRQKSREFLENKAKELGVGVNWLAEMAAKNPKAVMNFLGLENKLPGSSPMERTVNTDAKDFAPHGGPQRGTKEYYDAIRKENKSLYFSPKVQQEIFEAVKAGTYKT